MAKATPEALERLHEAVSNVLIAAVKSGDCDAATLNVARQFLKDNGVAVTTADTLKPLADGVGGLTLPFPSQAAEDDSPVRRRA